jgi:hypothetical protein
MYTAVHKATVTNSKTIQLTLNLFGLAPRAIHGEFILKIYQDSLNRS